MDSVDSVVVSVLEPNLSVSAVVISVPVTLSSDMVRVRFWSCSMGVGVKMDAYDAAT